MVVEEKLGANVVRAGIHLGFEVVHFEQAIRRGRVAFRKSRDADAKSSLVGVTTEFFDENVYPELLQYEKRDVNASIALIESIRASSISLFNNFNDEDWQRKGITSDGKEFVLIALIKKARSHISDHANQLSATL